MIAKSDFNVNRIIPDLRAGSRNQVFQLVAAQASRDTGIAEQDVYNCLTEGEKTSRAGIGGGVALPHIRMKTLRSPYALFAKLANFVDFEAVDNAPVDLFYLLLSPSSGGPENLRRLSRITRLLRDRNFCQKLRGAESEDALKALLMISPLESGQGGSESAAA